MVATEKSAVPLEAMTDDANAASRTDWGKRVDCTFETVVSVRLSVLDDLESFVIVVSASLTFSRGVVFGRHCAWRSFRICPRARWHVRLLGLQVKVIATK